MPISCPACGSTRTRTARYYSSDDLKRKLFFRPHRCRDCRHRFWLASRGKQAALALAILLTAGAFTWLAIPGQPTVEVSPLTRFDTLKQRAQLGDPAAQVQMGLRYLRGEGVDPNPTESARWFSLAAKQGDVEAEYQYGVALLEGRGVVQDYRAAYRWIEEPARRGHAKAQVTLADMYRFGSGLKADYARAYLWYNLAAAQGDENAARTRDNIATRLTPEQLMQMQVEARRILGQPLPSDTPAIEPETPQVEASLAAPPDTSTPQP